MSQGTNGVDPELQRVRRESRNCRICSGDGTAIVFHPRWVGRRIENLFTGEVEQVDGEDDEPRYVEVKRPTAMEVSAHCVCALGQWMRMRVDEDLRRRIPDVAAIVDGRSKWLLEPPVSEQEARCGVPSSRKVESIMRDMKSNLGAFTAS